MADVFKIEIYQTFDDKIAESNKKRFSSIKVPDNFALNELKVQLPIAYEGPEGENGLEKEYTPEHYFISAIASCFFTTFSVVSSNSNLRYISLHIEASGIIGASRGIKMMEIIEQKITLTIPSKISEKKALKVLELTEKRCPLANSVKTKIENTYNIIIKN
ncbi:MAG: OsmC family protein [Promethearchaeota archaeon]